MSDTRATLPPRFVLPLLGLFVVLGVTLRLPGIGRSLGHDELYTIVIFASRSWLDILSGYDLPNNHIFHTLCLRGVQLLLGDAEWSQRLPALLAGLAAIPSLYWFARRLTGAPTVGLLAALLLAGHHLHIGFSQTSRGYTLLVLLLLLFAGLLWTGITRGLARGTERAGTKSRPSSREPDSALAAATSARPVDDAWVWLGVVITGSLATLTLPSAALLIGAGTVGALLLIRRGSVGSRRVALIPLALAMLVILVHTALIYLPLWEDLRAHAARFGEPLVFTGFAHFVSNVWTTIGPPRLAWLMHLFTLWGLITLEGAQRGSGLFLGALIGLPLILNLALGTQAESRLYVFLVPFSLVAIAAGAESLRLLLLRNTTGLARWASALPILAALASFYHEAATPIETGYRDAGRFVTQQTSPGDLVIVPYIMDSGIGYYSDGATVERLRSIPESGIDRVLVLHRPGTPRFSLDDLMLSSNFTTEEADHLDTYAHLTLPSQAFVQVDRFGPTAIHTMQTSPVAINLGDLTLDDAWNLYYVQNPTTAKLAITPNQRLRLDPAGGAAVLHSQRRVRFSGNGLAVLALSRRGEGYASLYEVIDGETQAVQMVTPLAAPAFHVVDGTRVHADVALAPVVSGREYGLFLTAHGVVEAGNWQLSFLPYREPEP